MLMSLSVMITILWSASLLLCVLHCYTVEQKLKWAKNCFKQKNYDKNSTSFLPE